MSIQNYNQGKKLLEENRATEAIEYLKTAADLRNHDACYLLGVCYEEGTGIIQDMILAVKYYQNAADQGNALAQHSLGRCFFMTVV